MLQRSGRRRPHPIGLLTRSPDQFPDRSAYPPQEPHPRRPRRLCQLHQWRPISAPQPAAPTAAFAPRSSVRSRPAVPPPELGPTWLLEWPANATRRRRLSRDACQRVVNLSCSCEASRGPILHVPPTPPVKTEQPEPTPPPAQAATAQAAGSAAPAAPLATLQADVPLSQPNPTAGPSSLPAARTATSQADVPPSQPHSTAGSPRPASPPLATPIDPNLVSSRSALPCLSDSTDAAC
eukprot:2090131-Pleurochrysis_carterae.AAC.2